MATGLPVIALDVGGNPELVEYRKNGFLVDPHKPWDMANMIMAYLTDPEMMERHGRRGRLLAMEKFSIQAMVENYEAVYRTKAPEIFFQELCCFQQLRQTRRSFRQNQQIFSYMSPLFS